MNLSYIRSAKKNTGSTATLMWIAGSIMILWPMHFESILMLLLTSVRHGRGKVLLEPGRESKEEVARIVPFLR
ncbi:hypothetical protein H5410_056925 [Solanum commersonii]|uniref:Uncharacterized protein n=1 Tax=Solanum commersonii TaxID=4109 RepID=A0A9J5WNN4_SOLCO|nr:hypothetical protein H5410_056925 [Solanum commersonii]